MASVYEILFSTYRILNFVGRDSFNTDLCLILLFLNEGMIDFVVRECPPSPTLSLPA